MLKVLFLLLFFALTAAAETKKDANSAIALTQNSRSSNTRDDMLDEMEMLGGVTIMEVDEKGNKRWVLEGTHAKQSDLYKVRIFGVVVTLYRKDGTEVKLLTEDADVNRETGEIETDKRVTILDGDRTISGRGMYVVYTKEKRECKLFHEVEIKAKVEKQNFDVLKTGK